MQVVFVVFLCRDGDNSRTSEVGSHMPLRLLFQQTPDSATNPPDFGQSVLSHPDTLEFIRDWGILNRSVDVR